MRTKTNQAGLTHNIVIFIILCLCIIVIGYRVHARLAMVAPSQSGSSAAYTPAGPTGFVHESGRQLLDGNNAPLKVKGVDAGGWLEWEGWMWGKGLDYIGQTAMMSNLTSLVGSSRAQQFQTDVETNYISQADFTAMAADGLNVVRIPFNYTMLYTSQNTFKASGWSILDTAMAEARQAHVYVVPVMQEAPCGQSKLFFAGYTGGPTLWQSGECQNNTIAIWKAIAARYSNEPTILGYDLLGEPNTTNTQLVAFYKQLTTAIRQVDKNHVIIYEGNDFARKFSLFNGRLDNNQMLSFHAYAWRNNISAKLAQFDPYASSQDSPLYVGEYGQALYSELSQYEKAFANDSNVAGYTMWTWKQVHELPSAQYINETADSQKLIDWMNNTSRSKPSAAEAEQGMNDFINSIKYQNTTADQLTKHLLQ